MIGAMAGVSAPCPLSHTLCSPKHRSARPTCDQDATLGPRNAFDGRWLTLECAWRWQGVVAATLAANKRANEEPAEGVVASDSGYALLHSATKVIRQLHAHECCMPMRCSTRP
jgi:hypothetical protein